MAKYEIPDIFQVGFKLISGIDSETSKLILETISAAELGDEPEDLVSKSTGKSKIKPDDLSLIYRTIYTLISFIIEAEKTSSIVIQDMVDSYIELFPEQLSEKEILIKNLNVILEYQDVVTQTIKGYNLLGEGEKAYMKSRIISDMRLVFDNSINTKTRGVVLVHQLKITYRESGEWKEVFITMDSNDLNNLNETVLRTVEKEKLILNNTFTKELTFIKPKK